MTAKLMGTRTQVPATLKSSAGEHLLPNAARPRNGSSGGGPAPLSASNTGSMGRSVTFVGTSGEEEGKKKNRSIRLSVIGLSPIQPELLEAELEAEIEEQKREKPSTPRRDPWKKNQLKPGGSGQSSGGHLVQRQRRNQPAELQQLLMEEDGTCLLPPSAFSFSSVGSIVKDNSWGPAMVSLLPFLSPEFFFFLFAPDFFVHACLFFGIFFVHS